MKHSLFALVSGLTISLTAFAADLRLGIFDVDASPPIGTPLAYDVTIAVEVPLQCRGVVLLGSGDPIILCSLDWIGVGNASHRAFREQLAKACQTTVDRVSVHVIHQHDAPWSDASTDQLLIEHGIGHRPFDPVFERQVMTRAAEAAARAMTDAQVVTHLGTAMATVDKVASNRRILGEDGKVAHVRWTATVDPVVRAFPEGTIDPQLRMITFWNNDKPLAALTYYATHPQSYYRTGKANPDFPGLARNARESATGVPHIHFNGAGGNVGAGKYNDGDPKNRQVLADRMADAMKRAWEGQVKSPIQAEQVDWRSVPVELPPAPHLVREQLEADLDNVELPEAQRFVAANKLAWLQRCLAHETVDVGCLALGGVRVLHMPGELFVEYQLEAQRMRPDLFVAMAAYGDYGPGYIGTAVAYEQGGYETGPDASFVSPKVEATLMTAMREQLHPPLKVSTFNIRGDFDLEKASRDAEAWNSLTDRHRRDHVARLISEMAPDVMGVQEAFVHQLHDLEASLPGYAYYGIGRDDGREAGETCAIFYRTDRFQPGKQGTFWLSESPDVAGSKFPDAACTRIASWIVLSDRFAGGTEFLVVNTHWDHVSGNARRHAAEQIRRELSRLAEGRPTLVLGDMNAREEDPPLAILRGEVGDTSSPLIDAFRSVVPVRGTQEATFHNFRGQAEGSRIDFILHSDTWQATKAEIIRTRYDQEFPSDHFPVLTILQWKHLPERD